MTKSAPTQTHWSRMVERGSGFGMRCLFASYRVLGRTITRAMLYPVVLYFYCTARSARLASRQYLARLRAERIPNLDVSWTASFRHLHAFAESALDKLAAWSGWVGYSQIAFPQRAAFDELNASGRGAILVGAHLGNMEMTRALAVGENVATINAVVYTENAQRFTRILQHANAQFGASLMQVSSMGPDTAIALKDKVDRGELLFIMGDRTPPADNGRIVEASFLGKTANFAIGPWLLASLLECPVYLFFCLPNENDDGYSIHFEPFAEQVILPRKERQQALQGYAQRYADRLADYCVMAPHQWFNFFDFWRTDAGAAARSPKP